MWLFDFSEKIKIIVIASIFFIIGLILMIYVNNYSLNKINNQYMKQNMSIVGTIEKYNPSLVDKIIPIITKENFQNYENGQNILSKYSYNINNMSANPIMYKATRNNYILFAGYYSIIFILFMLYIYIKFNRLYNGLEGLNKKAQLIVDGKYIENEINEFKDGAIERLNVQFLLMQSRIKASIDLLNREKLNLKNIINDISHQFKTPIAAMTMYTDILKDSKEMDSNESEYFLDMTSEQVERMNWLVITLLKYARLESNVVEYQKKKQSINDTIKGAIEQFNIMAKEKDISLEFKKNNKDILFIHDRKWMQEALMNIIKNAIEHTYSGGFVKVELVESEVFTRIIITDNGEGIKSEELPRIFDRFHKGSNSVNPKSIGIGLALSKSIIESNSGSIKANSEIGVGSEFVITFQN